MCVCVWVGLGWGGGVLGLTSILSGFIEPQENIADFQTLLCKFQQTGKTGSTHTHTGTRMTRWQFYIIPILHNAEAAAAAETISPHAN